MNSSGACYACLHEPVSRADFLADVPPGAKHLLGYNEPDFKEQAHLSPDRARAHFGKPVCLTEFGAPSDDCGSDDPAVLVARTGAMLARDLPRFEAEPYLARYAWFMPKVGGGTLGHGDLIEEGSDGRLTELGELYLSAR